LSCVQIELSREPLYVLNWVRDAWGALKHLFATKRTLGRDRDAIVVISCLQDWHIGHVAILFLYDYVHHVSFFDHSVTPCIRIIPCIEGEIEILSVELDGKDGLLVTFSTARLADLWSRNYS